MPATSSLARRRRPAPTTGDPRIGAGRSGVVFRTEDSEGRTIARKVFDSDSLTKLVQVLFLGASNPYAWNEHAVQSAVLRRRILAPLVRFWFGDKLRVAQAWSQDWNEEYLAYQLHTEFVQGSPPALHHGMHDLGRPGVEEVEDLLENVMRPLQDLLVESGFDGLVWQAGLGNPVALGNYLRTQSVGGELRWAWIDLESGVPALFPISLGALFGFYLPRSFHHRRPLFDDVDVPRLRAYLGRRSRELERYLGADALRSLRRDVDSLRFHQGRWKSMPRLERSVACALAKRRIDPVQVAFYRQRPVRWYARELRRATRGVVVRGTRLVGRLVARVAALPFRRVFFGIPRFFLSHAYRWRLARRWVGGRIRSWERRGQLDTRETETLRLHLSSEESAAYLTDFGVHLAIKPFVKAIEFFVLPLLFLGGWLDEAGLALALVAAGSVARTLYTLGRFVQSVLRGRELPWFALFAGVLPVLGNLAYPVQIVASSTEEEDKLAQFILYDAFSILGQKIPIWGGKDTLTEHVLNRVPDRIMRRRST